MSKVRCSNCDKDAKVVKGSYPFNESGLNVVLQGIEIVRCKHCGNEDPIIPRLNDLMRTITVAIISKPFQLRGEDLRFLRKYLRMTAAEFAQVLDVDKTTLSKWENNGDGIGSQSDRLVRLTVLALGDGLKEKVDEVIRTVFPNIRRTGAKTAPKVGIEINSQKLTHQYT